LTEQCSRTARLFGRSHWADRRLPFRWFLPPLERSRGSARTGGRAEKRSVAETSVYLDFPGSALQDCCSMALRLSASYHASYCVAPMPLAPALGRGRFPMRSRGTLPEEGRPKRLIDRFAQKSLQAYILSKRSTFMPFERCPFMEALMALR